MNDLYRPFLETLYKDEEIVSNEQDISQMLGQLGKKTIDYDKVFSFMTK